MPITELALLRLNAGTSLSTPALRSALLHAKSLMQTYTNRSFYYLQQIEDPSLIYVLGEWDSLEQHMRDFIPEEENQAVLKSLEGRLGVEWLMHVGVGHAQLPVPVGGEAVWNVCRYFVKEGERKEFLDAVEACRKGLGEGVGGGWRVDGVEGREEFVMFVLGGGEGDGPNGELGLEIENGVEGVEMRGARVLDI
ncbi:hypothetical protein BDW02DRAFT_544447 [Decorospora gaudefroyi]|uniref:ABM domain-containing protein n=1 Tax=Decorospora gaudefroyi TaxID=184978 RepID=A0A6A5KN12_9PLEO|nr:hypothetical protein BDW02DRAFT_544447 [Decorospora gaudefroyi]